MKTITEWAPGLGVRISQTERIDGGWAVSATMKDGGRCPACDTRSSRRHGSYVRHLQDLPAHGAVVRLRLKLARWRCVNPDCARQTFGDRLPAVDQRPPDASGRRTGTSGDPYRRWTPGWATDLAPRRAPEQGHPPASAEASSSGW